MKKHFTSYLTEELGFKGFRNTGNGLVENKINDFSTTVPGGIHIIYVKDDVSVIWGLSEYGKPPTLVYPRPNIKNKHVDNSPAKFCIGGVFFNQDDDINKILSKYRNEEIYNAMFDKTILLEL